MQASGERRCVGSSLPTTRQLWIEQNWSFPVIFERTPEAASGPRSQPPSDILGEGTGGTVYKRQLELPRCPQPCPQCPPQICAVKRLGRNSEGHVLHAHSHDRRQREKNILEVLCKTASWRSSPKIPQSGYQFIVAFYGSYVKDDVIHIVMEYMPDGDLGHYIEVPWSERDAKIVAEQVLHALKFMHDHKVVHRDIKPHNIFPKMEDRCLTIKVGDFGVANRGQQNQSNLFSTYVGTEEYMAPERFGSEHTRAVDSWAVGCLLYRLLTGKDLFANPRATCEYEFTKRPCLKEELREFCQDSETLGFIDKLIQPAVEHRATPDSALEHPWLRELRENPGGFGRRLATQMLKDHFDTVKSAGIKPRLIS